MIKNETYPGLRLSLRAKIMVLCIGVTLALEFVIVLFIWRELSAALRQEYLSKGRVAVLNLAARSEHFVLTQDLGAISQLLRQLLASDQDVSYAYVMDRNNRVLAHTFEDGFPAGLININRPPVGRPWSMELLDTPEEGLVQDIASPILGGRAGAAHVGISERRILKTITRIARILMLIAGGALAVAVGLAAVVSWIITRPVVGLTRAAREISRGELGQKLVVTNHDEIGELVRAFNRMSEELLEKQLVVEDRNRLREALFLQEKLAVIGQITASVAHELNTPLSTVLMRTQLLKRQTFQGDISGELTVIERETTRCRGIIDSLLGFSRRAEGEQTRINPNVLVADSISLLHSDLLNKNIIVRHESGVLPEIAMDRDQIQQVILNLISNAAHAMHTGGSLTIQTGMDIDTAIISVIDTGCGMDDAVLQRAFEPFFTTKERGKGTGLGLAICQRIVREHNGTMNIQSRPDCGTTVTVRLPRA